LLPNNLSIPPHSSAAGLLEPLYSALLDMLFCCGKALFVPDIHLAVVADILIGEEPRKLLRIRRGVLFFQAVLPVKRCDFNRIGQLNLNSAVGCGATAAIC